MYRLNYMGDVGIKGLRTSCGIMINYRYVLDNIEDNSVNYEINGKFYKYGNILKICGLISQIIKLEDLFNGYFAHLIIL